MNEPREMSDLLLTQLEETGSAWLPSGNSLGYLVAFVETLGIDPNDVAVVTSLERSVGLRVVERVVGDG